MLWTISSIKLRYSSVFIFCIKNHILQFRCQWAKNGCPREDLSYLGAHSHYIECNYADGMKMLCNDCLVPVNGEERREHKCIPFLGSHFRILQVK